MSVEQCPFCHTHVFPTHQTCPRCRRTLDEFGVEEPTSSAALTNPYQPPTSNDAPTSERLQPVTFHPREPVKVKTYGLIPMTWNTYVALQITLAVAATLALAVLRYIVSQPGHSMAFAGDFIVPVLLVMLALEALETLLMRAKFRKAERLQAERLPAERVRNERLADEA